MSRTQEKINQPTEPVYAGIDVSKNTLDFCIIPHGITMTVSNDKKGIKSLIRECKRYDVQLVALEATGKYHCLLHEMLFDAEINAAVINPFRSRQFADSMGKLAKTDTIDAHVLARFAERMKPEPDKPPGPHFKALRSLQSARRQVVSEIGDLKRQLQTTDHPLAAKQIKTRITVAERHKSVLEDEIYEVINANLDMKHKFQILLSIPGIGKLTACVMIADLAELGQVNAKQIAALAGVAPMNWDSGARQGNRMIRGGRQSVRNALYMCAVNCTSRSGPLGSFYRRLIQRGKSPKVALTAVMRKLVIIANSLVAEDRHWRADTV
ncbi:IS110 family transposase [Yoonia sp. SS1-5]|uniref:IS110 family transposase n=1 Tax=Yoonia rhodophyticola TaxID=3137370 RepID=A0AAN0NL38_9RHOB